MIHNPYTFAMGDSREMRRVAELLDSVRTQLMAAYEEATGQQQQSLSDWMHAETWFDSAQAKDHGFATEIGGKSAAAACLRPPVAFRNPPAALIFDDRPPPRLKPHRQYAALRLAKFRYGNN